MPTLPCQRHLFDVPEDIAYFNSASYSPLLNASRERLRAGIDGKSHPWTRTADDFFEDADRVRQLAAGLFGGDADGYAVVPAASYAASTVARVLEPALGPGTRILVIEEEFPSDVLPWRRAARETGAELVTVPRPDGPWTPAILRHIDRGVTVVSVSTCHWTNGAAIDVDAVAAACRGAGAILVLDATQSLGAMPFDMAATRPDFLLAAGYKWLLSPYGFGLLWVADRWRDRRPLEESWITRDNARDFAGLVHYSEGYRPGARRFDVGETCVPTLLPGAIAALEQLRAWGIASIAETLAGITSRLAARLSERGYVVPPDAERCPHMFGVGVPGGDPSRLVPALGARGVYVSQRGRSLRISPHLHVSAADEARLLDALDALVPDASCA
ncbi:MAG: aminotransferase class V-fold PLP-dependent enzyme [Vicinamibacterales bacterium]